MSFEWSMDRADFTQSINQENGTGKWYGLTGEKGDLEKFTGHKNPILFWDFGTVYSNIENCMKASR